MNKVILIGNLGADPELNYTKNGTAVCNLRVATSKRWTDKDGQRQKKTEWHSVVVWGKQAEACGEYLHTGSTVAVDGELETRQWEDRDGNKRYKTEVVGRVEFLGKAEGQQGGGRRRRESPEPRQASSYAPVPSHDDGNEVPF